MQAQDRITKIDKSESILQPTAFISHGSPMVAIEFDDYSEQLCSFTETLTPPRAIVVVSAHWETEGYIGITSSEIPEQIYDFHGFPDTLYGLTYPCFGQPRLAEEISFLLNEAGFQTKLDDKRGIDHGVWIPLYITFPNVDIPVIQISIQKNAKPEDMLRVGNALSSLRKRGILLIGSGGIVHNLKTIKFNDKYVEPEQWALQMDNWFLQHLKNQDINKLLNFDKHVADHTKGAPTMEHLLPVFFILGCMVQKDHFVNIFEGFHYGTLSMRCFAYASNL